VIPPPLIERERKLLFSPPFPKGKGEVKRGDGGSQIQLKFQEKRQL